MPTLNPDFRGADEVIVPPNAQTGWTDGTVSLDEAVLRERRGQERLEDDMPIRFRDNTALTPLPGIEAQWHLFQKSKGRGEGSCDWSLLDEFVLKAVLLWLAQIIGSCVMSNTFRGWVIRLMYQISLLGKAEEFLGRNEFGPQNFAFYGPFSYGMARKRANMRGGDGLYCDVMAETLVKDGVLSCSTPKLIEILTALGAAKEKDFPEPQSERVYRLFGDWKYLDDLKGYTDFPLEECPFTTNADQLMDRLKKCMPTFCCSMLAIKKESTHKDGFAIHTRDTRNSWAHNMCFHGFFFASDGEIFVRFSNESWGAEHIYNVRLSEVADWYKRRNLTTASIGMIRGPVSAPPSIG